EEHVQIAIVVVVEKAGHRGLDPDIEPILRGHVPEVRNAVAVISLVDIKDIPPLKGVAGNGVADVDIGQPVVVDIDNRYAPRPSPKAFGSGFAGDIFESEMATIQIERGGNSVPAKKDIGQPVVVEVPDTDTAAIVHVDHIQRIHGIILGQDIV